MGMEDGSPGGESVGRCGHKKRAFAGLLNGEEGDNLIQGGYDGFEQFILLLLENW